MGAVKQEGHGRIVCNRVHHNRVLNRFVEKRISRWLCSKDPASRESPWEYLAVFGKEGSGHQVSCYLEVSSPEQQWQADEVAEGAQAALIRCLDRMSGLSATEAQWTHG